MIRHTLDELLDAAYLNAVDVLPRISADEAQFIRSSANDRAFGPLISISSSIKRCPIPTIFLVQLLESARLRALVDEVGSRDRAHAVEQRTGEVSKWVNEFRMHNSRKNNDDRLMTCQLGLPTGWI